jgi:HK97 family phage portal protein
MTALHPDQVRPTLLVGRVVYEVGLAAGYPDPTGRGQVGVLDGTRAMLHIRGRGGSGRLVAPSMIERYATQLGLMIARDSSQEQLYARGSRLDLVMSTPERMTAEQARSWRDTWNETHSGPSGSRVGVAGGGITLQPISMTPRDAQYAESIASTIDDAARITGVPASLLEGDTSESVEAQLARWLRFGLAPELSRVEAALAGDADLFQSSRDYAEFGGESIIRGDLLTEASIDVQLVQAGIETPDEARSRRGYPPLPGGVGAIPQITPVGGAPNPNATPASVPVDPTIGD